jgi:hypothetical protein
MVDKPVDKPARRRFRVSIRVLMLVILVLAVWVGWTVNRAKRQEAAIKNILRLRGTVGLSYTYQHDGDFRPFLTDDPPAPKWLLALSGPEYFRTVNFVGYAQARRPPSPIIDLSVFGGLPDVHELELDSTTFDDSDMVHVRRLELTRFMANDTPLGDDGLACLAGMRKLSEIGLADTRITDKGLTHLATMPMLKTVNLAGLKVTDAGLAYLSKLTNLRSLTLSATLISDAGLVHLSGLKQLIWLGLSGTHVTDAGLEHLKALPRLKSLTLPKTGVTDAAIERLRDAFGQSILIDQE